METFGIRRVCVFLRACTIWKVAENQSYFHVCSCWCLHVCWLTSQSVGVDCMLICLAVFMGSSISEQIKKKYKSHLYGEPPDLQRQW